MDADLFQAMTGSTPQAARVWAPEISASMVKWDIHTNLQVSMFIAQMSHECRKWTRFEEDLNYSAMGLANTWPNRYAVLPDPALVQATNNKPVEYIPNDLAKNLARNPKMIANVTYANRLGNGPAASGDGWNYRGRGPKQITGKDNYMAYQRVTGIDATRHPDLLLEPDIGSDAAGWYWSSHNCNDYANQGDFRAVTKAINGGYIGLAERMTCWSVARTAGPYNC